MSLQAKLKSFVSNCMEEGRLTFRYKRQFRNNSKCYVSAVAGCSFVEKTSKSKNTKKVQVYLLGHVKKHYTKDALEGSSVVSNIKPRIRLLDPRTKLNLCHKYYVSETKVVPRGKVHSYTFIGEHLRFFWVLSRCEPCAIAICLICHPTSNFRTFGPGDRYYYIAPGTCAFLFSEDEATEGVAPAAPVAAAPAVFSPAFSSSPVAPSPFSFFSIPAPVYCCPGASVPGTLEQQQAGGQQQQTAAEDYSDIVDYNDLMLMPVARVEQQSQFNSITASLPTPAVDVRQPLDLSPVTAAMQTLITEVRQQSLYSPITPTLQTPLAEVEVQQQSLPSPITPTLQTPLAEVEVQQSLSSSPITPTSAAGVEVQQQPLYSPITPTPAAEVEQQQPHQFYQFAEQQQAHASQFAPALHTTPFAPALHTTPFAQQAHASQFAPALHTTPFAQQAHASQFAPALHTTPFAQQTYVGQFDQQTYVGQFAPASTASVHSQTRALTASVHSQTRALTASVHSQTRASTASVHVQTDPAASTASVRVQTDPAASTASVRVQTDPAHSPHMRPCHHTAHARHHTRIRLSTPPTSASQKIVI